MKAANTDRRRRSVKLTPDERKELRKWVSKFDTKTDALEQLGLRNMGTLDRVLNIGSGSPETIETIKSKIAA